MEEKQIIRYIMGKADRAERRRMSEWLMASPENMERFASLKAKYVFSSMPNTILPEKENRLLPTLIGIAAALFIPLLAGAIYLFIERKAAVENFNEASRQVELLSSQTPGFVTYFANPGTKSIVVLPDSSVVRLNGNSKLIVPQTFSPLQRELSLSGEGYFEVTHHEDWPMLIHTPKGVSVNVLGTTFDLSAYENDAALKLTLVEGKVTITEEKTNHIHEVRPNQEIRISDRSVEGISALAAPEIKKADIKKSTGWINGELIFDNTPMPEVAQKLERWYGVNIHISDNDILKYHFTATFTTESITRVLDLIRFSTLLDYDINGTDVYISHGKRR
ncbi:MAG: DUF4974 domain-containing protein [Bacteroidales bacterium]|nr:DUF4974 domain-containing protein [Bacteroidales bacterium]